MKKGLLVLGVMLSSAAVLSAASLTEGTFTDVIHTVDVLDASTKTPSPAQLNELVKAPNLVRTGASSRAELTAPDQTLTRIGANTVFSFAPSGREINLEQGSVLFHSPSGRGGGTVRSGGASAAVSGTTIIVAATPVNASGQQNGFKMIVLEGTGRATLPNGRSRTLKAGQMIYILPGSAGFGPLLTINLAKLVDGSALVNGFSHPLPSLGLIDAAIDAQIAQLKKGRLSDTGIPADTYVQNPPVIGSGFHSTPGGDPNVYQTGVAFPPIDNHNNGGPPFSTGPTLLPPPPPPARKPPPPPTGAPVGAGFTFLGASQGLAASTLTLIPPPSLLVGPANTITILPMNPGPVQVNPNPIPIQIGTTISSSSGNGLGQPITPPLPPPPPLQVETWTASGVTVTGPPIGTHVNPASFPSVRR